MKWLAMRDNFLGRPAQARSTIACEQVAYKDGTCGEQASGPYRVNEFWPDSGTVAAIGIRTKRAFGAQGTDGTGLHLVAP